ncbi:hypothetical protein [Brevibacillus fulvus]|uniref:Uncharacterized protein n=1 Tax=Brevibacillus fulvus TaxID=1125967 RepID=A0A938Y2X4_9BACL|nr:hypothetical protein [Brevibacillus fulvus]MBM7592301.1 hypothetical protein [Brevibacillus fulvus]
MATVEAHQEVPTSMGLLLGKRLIYQKHKPGKCLSVERLPREAFQIESIRQFGSRIIINDGMLVLESIPTVTERKGRIALLLPTGEELYFYVD